MLTGLGAAMIVFRVLIASVATSEVEARRIACDFLLVRYSAAEITTAKIKRYSGSVVTAMNCEIAMSVILFYVF